jgi:pilus assembly protein CpaF
VIDVIRVDIHLNYTADGRRYIERISEIVKLDVSVPYPEYDPGNPVDSMNNITKEYYTRQTDRKSFATRDILRYNLETDTYEPCEWFTTELTRKMLEVMPPDKTQEFKAFILDNWRL